jgi:hypothetical protein
VRRALLIIALNALAAVIYAYVAVRLGFFGNVNGSLFWSPDSHSYRDVADWLFGGPNTFESMHRPFLYPLLLGASQRIGGAWGIWGLNLICWFGTLNLTAASAWRLTGRIAAGVIVFLVLATDVSIIVLTFQALTEPLTLLLESLWIAGLAWSSMPPARPRDFAFLLLPIALLTVVKPGYQLETLIAIVLLGITLLRLPRRRLITALAVAACCIPIALQIGLNATANHFVGLSSTGELEFKDYYLAQVYAKINHLPIDLAAARQAVAPMHTGEMLRYLLDHPRDAAGTLIGNFRGNLTSPSNFIDASKNPALWSLVRYTNRAFLYLHVVMVPVVLFALWRRRDARLLLLYAFAAILVLLPSLIYDQGDRYIQMAVPFWAVAYALAITELLKRERRLPPAG